MAEIPKLVKNSFSLFLSYLFVTVPLNSGSVYFQMLEFQRFEILDNIVLIFFFWQDLLSCSSCSCGSGEAMESEQKNIGSGTQRISVSDHINAFQYTAEKADSFVIDMDAFSSANNKDTTNANSRITVNLSLSSFFGADSLSLRLRLLNYNI